MSLEAAIARAGSPVDMLFDQSHQMTDLFLSGPDSLRQAAC